MKSRVAEAMYKVWENRAREICGTVQFGGATKHCGCHCIRFARVGGEPEKVVGVFHLKRHGGAGEFEVVEDRHYHPPVHRARLGPGYQELFTAFDKGGVLVWIRTPAEVFN